MSGWCSGSLIMVASCAPTASRTSASSERAHRRRTRRSMINIRQLPLLLDQVNPALRAAVPSWVATGERAIAHNDAAAAPTWMLDAGGDSRNGKVSYPGRGAALWVSPRVQAAGRRVAEVGAWLAPAGGWRMEFEIGSLPSASATSRPAAFP